MKIARAVPALSTLAAAAVLLAGCGGPPADGGSYNTATELKDAFVKAGGQCDEWKPDSDPPFADATAGSCGRPGSDDYLLYVFADKKDRNFIVTKMADVGVAAVAGLNWMILGSDEAAAHKLLGGELIPEK